MQRAHQTLVIFRDTVDPERAERFITSLNRYDDDALNVFGIDLSEYSPVDQAKFTTLKADVVTVVGQEIVEGLVLTGDHLESTLDESFLRRWADDKGYTMSMVVA